VPVDDFARLLDVRFAAPQRAWIGIAVAILLIVVPLVRRRARTAVVPIVLRALGIAALLAVLLEPYFEWTTRERGRVMALADVSVSMGEDGLAAVRRHLEHAPADVEIYAFAEHVIPARPAALTLHGKPGTDIGAALRRAAADAAGDRPTRVVLLSDGRANRPGAGRAARDLRRCGAQLAAVAVPEREDAASASVRIRGLRVTARETRDDPYRIETTIQVEREGTVDVRLFLDGVEIQRRSEPLGLGQHAWSFDPIRPAPGLHVLQCLVLGDDTPGDNSAFATLAVPGTPRVLCLAARKRDALIANALATQGFDVTVGAPGASLEGFDAVVLLPDAPADADYDALPEFVGKGGGLVAIGGAEGDGLARLHGTPVSFLLPLAVPSRPEPPAPPPPPDPEPDRKPRIEIEERETQAFPITLCLVIDRSGSMAGAKLERAKAAAVAAADALTDQDRIAVISFGDTGELVVPPQHAGRAATIRGALRRMQAGGHTAMYAALAGAYNVMRREKSPIRHIVLLSDGLPSDEGRWRDLVRTMTDEKITLSSVGIGWDFDKHFLLRLAQWGRGKYWSANHPTNIPQVVTQDTLRLVEARDQRGKDAERSKPEAPEEKPQRDPAPPPRDVEPETASPPEAVAIVANPAVPRDMLKGVADAALPAVAGFEAGTLRFSAWAAAFAGEDGPPLLGYWRVGLGQVAVWTVDPEAKHAASLREHDEFARLIAQLMRSVLPDVEREPVAVSGALVVDTEGERLVWRVRGEDGAVRTDLHVGATLAGAALPVRRRGGRYEVVLPRHDAIARVDTQFGDGATPLATRPFLVAPSRPLERAGLGADRDALRRLVRSAEQIDPPRDALWRAPHWYRNHRRALDLPFLALAAILLPLDAWARRRAGSASP